MNKKFQGIGGQIFFLAMLMHFTILLVRREMVNSGDLWGKSTVFWIWTSIFAAIFHQVYVFLIWRLELYGNNLTKFLGKLTFPLYAFFFGMLILLRPILLIPVALSNIGSFPIYEPIKWGLLIILGFLGLYTQYSVARFFGFKRAFGIDHFDPRYRNIPLNKGGIFKHFDNSMYLFGFLILWLPGIYFESSAALVVAFFQHAYIWVHYFFLEKIDMKTIYEN